MATKMKTSTSHSSALVKGIETLLADSYAIMAQTHLAHWNVEGTDFFQLHGAFQSQYEELFKAIDDIAEHLRTLEAYAPGGLKMLSGMSSVHEMGRREKAKDYVAGLVEAHNLLIENAVKTRDIAGDAGDKESEDLFIERLRVHRKVVWLLSSYLK